MTSTHQFSLTLVGAITAMMLAVTATVASFVVIPTPQARSAEAAAETEALNTGFYAPVSATIPWISNLEVDGSSGLHERTPDVPAGG